VVSACARGRARVHVGERAFTWASARARGRARVVHVGESVCTWASARARWRARVHVGERACTWASARSRGRAWLLLLLLRLLRRRLLLLLLLLRLLRLLRTATRRFEHDARADSGGGGSDGGGDGDGGDGGNGDGGGGGGGGDGGGGGGGGDGGGRAWLRALVHATTPAQPWPLSLPRKAPIGSRVREDVATGARVKTARKWRIRWADVVRLDSCGAPTRPDTMESTRAMEREAATSAAAACAAGRGGDEWCARCAACGPAAWV
jgi:hypothetical protein